MHAMTSAERQRRTYIGYVRRLVRAALDTSIDEGIEQNAVWESWLTLQDRTSRDLSTLLESDVADAFKARAFAILSAPRLDWAPYAWVRSDTAHDHLGAGHIAHLPPSLRDLGLRLLVYNMDTASKYAGRHRGDEHVQSWEWGTYPYYNAPILGSLECLTEDDPWGAYLCDRYELVGHRYWPFDVFIKSKLQEKWVRIIDERMRELITKEQEGRTRRQDDYEPAVDRYLHFIGLPLYGDGALPYSFELFVSQVEFVLGLPNTEGCKLFRGWRLDKAFEVLGGEDHKELRYKLARSLLRGSRVFKIHNGNDLAAIRVMQVEFAKEDPVLEAQVELVLAEFRMESLEKQGCAATKQSRAEEMLARMR